LLRNVVRPGHPAGQTARHPAREGKHRGMAIFHLSAVMHSRGKGHSAVAGAAYRARDAMIDQRTGERHNYSRNAGDVLFAGIYAPKDAPEWTRDRAQLWNHVEAFEKRRDAQLARVFDIALPHELTLEQNRRLLQDWVRDNFTRKGLIADAVIHAADRKGDQRNTHAHVAVVLRKLDGTEFAARKERPATNDERLAELESWRASWEKLANRHLERAGVDARIDRRTLKEQGIEAEPTRHLGPTATEMEKRGVASERGDLNRDIAQRNVDRRMLKALHAEAQQIAAAIIELESGREAADQRHAASSRYSDVRTAQQDSIEAERRAHSETAQVFPSAATRATEPAAPIFDRDAGEAIWLDKVAAAGIAKDGAMRAAQESPQPAQPAAGMEARAAAEPTQAPAQAREFGPESEDGARSFGHVFGGILGGFGKTVMNFIAELADFLTPPPALTKDQAERAELVALERHEQQAVAAYHQQVRDHDEVLAEQLRTRDIARVLQIDPVSDPEEDRQRLQEAKATSRTPDPDDDDAYQRRRGRSL
jgi:MobA/MobL family